MDDATCDIVTVVEHDAALLPLPLIIFVVVVAALALAEEEAEPSADPLNGDDDVALGFAMAGC